MAGLGGRILVRKGREGLGGKEGMGRGVGLASWARGRSSRVLVSKGGEGGGRGRREREGERGRRGERD